MNVGNVSLASEHDSITKTRYTVIRITRLRPSVYAPNGQESATQTTFDMSVASGFRIAINAGLYDSTAFGDTNRPEGIVIANGEIIQNKPASTHPGSMPLIIDQNGRLWHADAEADANDLLAQGITDAVCGFMPIIIGHEAVPHKDWPQVAHFDKPHARQIIGQYANGDYAIITSEGCTDDESCGWTIEDAQRVCLMHGLEYAYNLDGGTSTATVIDGKQINPFYKGKTGRIVPTYIVFIPRTDKPHP